MAWNDSGSFCQLADILLPLIEILENLGNCYDWLSININIATVFIFTLRNLHPTFKLKRRKIIDRIYFIHLNFCCLRIAVLVSCYNAIILHNFILGIENTDMKDLIQISLKSVEILLGSFSWKVLLLIIPYFPS